MRFDDPTHDYHADGGYLCTRTCLKVTVPNVVVDGFTILRSREDGVLLSGTPVRNVTIKNCIIKQSTEDGIDVTQGIGCVLQTNVCAENTKNGIILKTITGGVPVEDCTVSGNTCYQNNNQSKADDSPDDDINGIRIGNASGSPRVGHHLIVNNKTYSNEDSGVDARGSNTNTFRYNQSWANSDHGFDHNGASYNVHIGDLAYANGHDGFSFENNAHANQTHNCVMADNGRAVNRQDYELEVLGAVVDSFISDRNVIYRPSHATNSCSNGSYSWDEVRDTVLIAWNNPDRSDLCRLRCYPESTLTCFGTVARFAAATSRNPNQNELHSKQGDPLFVDASVPNFRPFWSSPGLDAADTTISGWQTTDLLGFARYELAGKANTGNPAGTFADIGPYEYSDGMSAVDSVAGAYNTVSISWTASGRYGNGSYKPLWYKIYVDGVLKRTRISANMSWPGYIVESGISASVCNNHTVYVTTMAESASASHKDVTQSSSVSVTTCCSPGCSDGPELSSRRAREENADFPLALEWVGANPAHGAGVMNWSIPRVQAGAAYDLSLFDVAGRRVATIDRGAAKAGKYTHELSFQAGNGSALPNGVFFLRLRIGREILNKTVVLAR